MEPKVLPEQTFGFVQTMNLSYLTLIKKELQWHNSIVNALQKT
jgi:hypothetical protein